MVQKVKILPSLLIICLCHILLYADEHDLSKIDEKINELLKKEVEYTLSVASSQPDRRISGLMEKIDDISQELRSQDQNEESIDLQLKCLNILAALRERRVYSYMLWAEGLLESATSGRYANLLNNDQQTLMKLYCQLSEIDISIVRENMLNREVMTRLSEIYDCLTPENKKIVRLKAIQQQRKS